MTWLNEAVRSIVTAFAIVTGNASAIDRLDLSEQGFWRSFAAIIPIAPLYLYAASIAGEEAQAPASDPVLWFGLSLLAQWIAWPLAVAIVARTLGWGAKYARYIVAYNWTSVWVIVVLMPPVVLYVLGFSGGPMMNVIVLASFFVALWMRWFVARHGLEVSGAIAVALVLADLLLGNAIEHTFTSF
jgi:hypothetical protein